MRAKLGLADNRVTVRSFGNEPRAAYQPAFVTSWMNHRFAARISISSLYGVENDWKGRKDEGLTVDGSYLAARLGNWSGRVGKIDRWWGPGWDGSLIMSTNARPSRSFARPACPRALRIKMALLDWPLVVS